MTKGREDYNYVPVQNKLVSIKKFLNVNILEPSKTIGTIQSTFKM